MGPERALGVLGTLTAEFPPVTHGRSPILCLDTLTRLFYGCSYMFHLSGDNSRDRHINPILRFPFPENATYNCSNRNRTVFIAAYNLTEIPRQWVLTRRGLGTGLP